LIRLQKYLKVNKHPDRRRYRIAGYTKVDTVSVPTGLAKIT
jgi:hypothetical protein